jgi:hypothetical protein
MTNPEYKGDFKKEPLSLGLPVLDKQAIIHEFLKANARKGGLKTAKRGKKYFSMIGKLSAKARKAKKKDLTTLISK